MLNKRIATIEAGRDLGTNGTQVYDINIKDAISRIMLRWRYTVATASVMLHNPRESIRKVEIIDGSTIILSLTGQELSAMDFLSNLKPPFSRYSLTAADYCEMIFNIDFGRYLWDESLALKPEMFSNPQIRITWDEDYSNTSVVANQLEIYAFVFTNSSGDAAVGYLRKFRHYAYTRTVSAHEYVDMPVDEVIRKIVLVGGMTDYSLLDLVDNFKLSLNGDEEVPYDVPGKSFIQLLDVYKEFSQKIVLDNAVTAKDIYSDFGADNELLTNYDDTAFVTAQSKFAEAAAPAGSFIDIAASVDIKSLRGLIIERLPFNAMPFGFGDDWVPDTWMQLNSGDKLRADILATATDPTIDEVSVVVEQMKRY